MDRDDLIDRIANGLEEDLRLRLKQMRIDRDVLRRGIEEYIPTTPTEPAAEGTPASELARSLSAIDAGSSQREVLGTMLQEINAFAGGGALIILVGEGVTAWPGPGLGLGEGEEFGSKKIPLDLPEDSLVARAAREAQMLIAPFPGAPGDPAIYRALGQEPPDEIAAIPMAVRSRVQAVVLVEGRGEEGRIADPDALAILVRFAGFVIDLLPLKKKLGEIRMPQPTRVPRSTVPEAQPPEPVEEEKEKAEPEFELLDIESPPEGEEPEIEVVPEADGEVMAEPEVEIPAPPPVSAEPEPEAPLVMEEPEPEFEVIEEPEEAGEELEIEVAEEPVEAVEELEIEAAEEPQPAAAEPEELTTEPEEEEDILVPESRGLSVEEYDLSGLSDDEREKHEKAIRFARLIISEIKLYNEETVKLGRENADILTRLHDDIERSRALYKERIDADVRENSDYLRSELIRQLADGDESLLGE